MNQDSAFIYCWIFLAAIFNLRILDTSGDGSELGGIFSFKKIVVPGQAPWWRNPPPAFQPNSLIS